MNLVAKHYHTVLLGERGHTAQRVGIPLYTYRVVGIAENHHARMLRSEQMLQMFEVHIIVDIGIHLTERILQHNASVAFGDDTERMVHRGLYHHLVARTGEEV